MPTHVYVKQEEWTGLLDDAARLRHLIDELEAENERLRNQLTEMQDVYPTYRAAINDAERYRFIRDYQVSVLEVDDDGKCVWIVNAEEFHELDAAIDAAINAA